MHTCEGLKFALDNDYLDTPIQLLITELRILPPRIPGSGRGKKAKPGLFLNYCPFCGAKFDPIPQDEHSIEVEPETQV